MKLFSLILKPILCLCHLSVLSRKLSHQNIVRYIGTEVTPTALSIFLEYIPGGSLKCLIEKFGFLEEPVVRTYSRQLLLGLEYLHRNGIAHRDVKGANCLVGNDGVIKLADFGASKTWRSQAVASGSPLSNKTGEITGTPSWMAPEVIRDAQGERQIPWKKADIWSLGCTVLEMTTGKPPWHQFSNQVTVLYHIACSDLIPEFPEYPSEEMSEFLSSCLQREPSHRPDTTSLLLLPFVAAGMNVRESFKVGVPGAILARPTTVSTETIGEVGDFANWRVGTAFAAGSSRVGTRAGNSLDNPRSPRNMSPLVIRAPSEEGDVSANPEDTPMLVSVSVDDISNTRKATDTADPFPTATDAVTIPELTVTPRRSPTYGKFSQRRTFDVPPEELEGSTIVEERMDSNTKHSFYGAVNMAKGTDKAAARFKNIDQFDVDSEMISAVNLRNERFRSDSESESEQSSEFPCNNRKNRPRKASESDSESTASGLHDWSEPVRERGRLQWDDRPFMPTQPHKVSSDRDAALDDQHRNEPEQEQESQPQEQQKQGQRHKPKQRQKQKPKNATLAERRDMKLSNLLVLGESSEPTQNVEHEPPIVRSPIVANEECDKVSGTGRQALAINVSAVEMSLVMPALSPGQSRLAQSQGTPSSSSRSFFGTASNTNPSRSLSGKMHHDSRKESAGAETQVQVSPLRAKSGKLGAGLQRKSSALRRSAQVQGSDKSTTGGTIADEPSSTPIGMETEFSVAGDSMQVYSDHIYHHIIQVTYESSLNNLNP